MALATASCVLLALAGMDREIAGSGSITEYIIGIDWKLHTITRCV
jgi:hypothetical protein